MANSWTDISELVAGKAIQGRLSLNALRSEAFMPPYDEIIKLLKQGKEKEVLCSQVGFEAVQSCLQAAESVNGLGEKLDLIAMLEKSYSQNIIANTLEQWAKRLRKGEDIEAPKIKLAMTQYSRGKTGRTPLSEIDSSEMPFISSGWKVWDDHLVGFPKVGLVVIAGESGVGKTTLMGKQAGCFVKAHPDKRVGIYSLEMVQEEIAARFRGVCNLTKDEEARIEINADSLGTEEVLADAASVDNLGLVMIDFADYLLKGEVTEATMARLYVSLALGSKDLGCPIILIAQFSYKYDGGIPKPKHIRWTSMATTATHMLIMLYNPEKSFSEDDSKQALPTIHNGAYLIAWKVRGGFRNHIEDNPGAIAVPFTPKTGWGDKARWYCLAKEST